MDIVYAREPFPTVVRKTIFLAGPTPRSEEIPSWRTEALAMLERFGYDGTVFVPEDFGGGMHGDKHEQMEWERRGLERTDCIVFWVPRDLAPDARGQPRMAALTTNVEFGWWMQSGKVVLGTPSHAPHTGYLRWHADRLGIPRAETLEGTLRLALDRLGDGAERTGGECDVPLHVWRIPSFHAWYRTQVAAGNRLDGARVEWIFRPDPNRAFVFFWAIHVDVYVATEGRNKTNEVVFARPDISSIVCYRKHTRVTESDVVLIHEFRSPAVTGDGFIRENAGGSAHTASDPAAVAVAELAEETGLHIAPDRFRFIGTRQVAGTLSAHRAHCYAVEVTDDELAWLRTQTNVPRGVAADTERTYVEIRTVSELLADPLTDWANLGMIFAALFG